MSTIIRDAVIRLRIEQQKANLESPSSGVGAVYKAEAKAATEAKKATEEATRTAKEHQVVVTDTMGKSAASFREGGEGALRMARGIAFLSAAGGADLQKLVQKVAIAQGAFDVFAGGLKLITNAAAFGPVGLAVAGVAAALAAGALAWTAWTAAQEEAKRKAEEMRTTLEDLARAESAATDARAARMSGVRIGSALTEDLRIRRMGQEKERLFKERGDIEQELFTDGAGQQLRRANQTPGQRRDLLSMMATVDPRGVESERQLQQRLYDNADAQMKIDQELYGYKKRQGEILRTGIMDATRAGIAGAGAIGGMAPGFSPFAMQGAALGQQSMLNQFDSSVAASLNTAQKAIDKFVSLMNDASLRIQEVEGAQKQAEAANNAR